MGDLSKNFSRHEFACRCCGRTKINQRLVDALQELRDLTGEPVRISSGYRCPEHNQAIGGATRSQHLLGTAADIVVIGMTPAEMYRLAEDVEAFRNGGIGVYPDKGFIHVDVRDGRARWGQLDGKYVALVKALKNTGGNDHATA
ncbi:MAG: peptidase M15 [Deltaproteobacteria bacterium]|nr:MAG: peptidase M15 [Deltaproteobacteria bacterium]